MEEPTSAEFGYDCGAIDEDPTLADAGLKLEDELAEAVIAATMELFIVVDIELTPSGEVSGPDADVDVVDRETD